MELEEQEKTEMTENNVEEKSAETKRAKPTVKVSHIIRWTLLLLVVFCGVSIVVIPYFHILIFIVQSVNPREPFRIIAEIFMAIGLFSYGLSFIYLGAVIAPKYKKSIAYTTSVLSCLLYFIAHFTFLFFHGPSTNSLLIWFVIQSHTIITALYLLLGGVFAAALVPVKKSVENEISGHPLPSIPSVNRG